MNYFKVIKEDLNKFYLFHIGKRIENGKRKQRIIYIKNLVTYEQIRLDLKHYDK